MSDRRWNRGLIIGDFAPPHLGHLSLWLLGLKYTKQVVIGVCSRPDDEISGERRAQWVNAILESTIRRRDPGKEPLFVVDHIDTAVHLPWGKDGSEKETARLWAEFMHSRYRENPIDVIISAEAYGAMMAEVMGIDHLTMNRAESLDVSSRQVRADLGNYLDHLPVLVQAEYMESAET